MKTILLALTVFLAGCVSMDPPVTSQERDWYAFGKDMGEQGYTKKTDDTLAKMDKRGILNASLYNAYLSGYEQGRGEYCNQDAFKRGFMGEFYWGACDDIDPYYLPEFISGRHAAGPRY